MKEISEAITRISGRRGRRAYQVLICAVQVALSHMPEELSMAEICRETGQLCTQSPLAVNQAASRAVKDIWEHGDRQELIRLLGRVPREKPSPKDLIIELAQIFWSKTPV